MSTPSQVDNPAPAEQPAESAPANAPHQVTESETPTSTEPSGSHPEGGAGDDPSTSSEQQDHVVPLPRLLEERDRRQKLSSELEALKAERDRFRQAAEQWDQMSPDIAQRLEQAQKLERDLLVAQKEREAYQKYLQENGLEYQPDVQGQIGQQFFAEDLRREMQMLRQEIPRVLESTFQQREREAQERQAQMDRQRRQSEFETALNEKIYQIPTRSFKEKEMLREMVMSHAERAGFEKPVDHYTALLGASPAPAPAPGQRQQPPHVPSQSARPPAPGDDVLGEYADMTIDRLIGGGDGTF